MKVSDLKSRRAAPLATSTGLRANATRDVAAALNLLLADAFALYVKTKNFHWHMSGPHFRDYHLLLDEQSDQIFAMTDPLAERVRKLGGTTLRSVGHIARMQRVLDNDAERRKTCWLSCAMIINRWLPPCARPTRFATRKGMWRARV
jgi:starvation-inducible DNA-binding protein